MSMADTGSGWEFLWPAMLWQHRTKLRRKHPFLFYTSILVLLALALFLTFAAWRDHAHP